MLQFIIRALMRFFGMFPLGFHYFNARWMAWLLYRVVGYRRDEVLINLTRCFPEKEYNELKAIAKAFYLHFAELLVESIWFGACQNPGRLHKARIMENRDVAMMNALYDKYPSVMVMYSHTGNWELYGGYDQYDYSNEPKRSYEANFCVVYRQLSSKLWDDIIRLNRIAPVRDKENFRGYVESKKMARYVYENKDKKIIYNVNTDQRPYFNAPHYIECDFLHHRVHTMSAAAALAQKFGMAVVYLNLNRTRQGHYLMEFTPICENAKDMTVEEMMQKYFNLLEEDIRRNPANYLWTHRRFWF